MATKAPAPVDTGQIVTPIGPLDRGPEPVPQGTATGVYPQSTGSKLPQVTAPRPVAVSSKMPNDAGIIPVTEQPVDVANTVQVNVGSSGAVSRFVNVYENGNLVVQAATAFDFTGNGVAVTTGNNISIAQIEITGGGGNVNVDWNNVNNNILPVQTTTYNLGSTSNRWASVFAVNVETIGEVSAAGNILGNYIFGNGSQLTGISSNYGNANVAANLAAFGSNPISTTGNITGGYIFGNGSQLTGITSTPVNTGNITFSGTSIEIAPGAGETNINVSPTPEGWAFVQLPNNATANTANTRVVNAGGNVTIETGDFSIGGSNVYTWAFDTYGTLKFPGNTVVQDDIEGTGNFGFETPANVGFGILANAGSSEWVFGPDGNLTIPGSIIGTATVAIDNRATGNSADIQLYSADDILLQARDRTLGSGSEGGDINIFAGNSAEDGDASGGDITIEAGNGGAANVDNGGSGGFVTVQAGAGGDASTQEVGIGARNGGALNLRAGSAGSNMGNIDRGSSGGNVDITAGVSTGNLAVGGSINLSPGQAGANALAGGVFINIPTSDEGPGGQWIFSGSGQQLTVPQNAEIYGPSFGNLTMGAAGNVILTSSDYIGNTYYWRFGSTGTLTAPGDVEIGTGNTGVQLRSNQTGLGFYATIAGITNGSSTVVVTLNDVEFTEGDQGTVTITGVLGETEANGFWGWRAVEVDQIQLYTDGTFSTPVDGTTWGAYDSGGLAVSSGYNELDIQGGSVAIISGAGKYWSFKPDGTTLYPTLTVTRGDRTGTLTGQALVFGDATQEALISTPNGTSDINSSQRFVINPGAGYANTTGEGGDIYLYAGRGGSAGGSGGDIKIRGGLGPADGAGGYLDIMGGEAAGNGAGGRIDIQGGQSANSTGGPVQIYGGQGTTGAEANITGGTGSAGPGGAVNITGGTSSNGLPEYGNVNITSGASTWTFNNAGVLTLPGEGVVRSINDVVTIESYDTANAVGLGFYVGTNGGLFFKQGANPNWLTIIPNASNAEISSRSDLSLTSGTGTSGAAGNNISITAGAADQSDYYTTPGGNVNITGGLGAGNDGGGGGPGGWVNIIAGDSTDPAGVPGNVTINSGPNTWTFDYNGTLNLPEGTSYIGSAANSLTLHANDSEAIYISAISGGISAETNGNITLISNVDGVTNYAWTFDNTGNLTLPTNTFSVNYANGTPVSIGGGGGSYGNADVTALLAALGSNVISGTGNITTTANISGGYIFGNGSQLTGLPATYGNANVAAYLPTYTGNLAALTGNVTTTANISGNYFIGNGALLTGITASGGTSIVNGTSNVSVLSSANITVGVAGTSNVAVFATNGAFVTGNVSATGNVQAGNLLGTVATAAQASITSLGTLTSLTVSGAATFSGTTTAIGIGTSQTTGATTIGGTAQTANITVGQSTATQIINLGIGATSSANTKTINLAANGVANSTSVVNIFSGIAGNSTLNIGASTGNTTVSYTANTIVSIANVGGAALSVIGNITGGNLSATGNINGANFVGTGANVSLVAGVYTSVFDNGGNLTLPGNVTATGNISGSYLYATYASGDEGGEIQLTKPPNGTLSGGISIDAYTNRMRVFEQGGTARGLYFDIANAPAGVSAVVGYRDSPQVSFTGDATIAATDAGKHYYSTLSTGNTLTIANNTSVGWSVGTEISIVNRGTANITIAQDTGVSLYLAGNSIAANRTLTTYGMATIMNVAGNIWMINGTGVV